MAQGCIDRRLFTLGLFQTWLFVIFHSSTTISFEQDDYFFLYSATIVFTVITLVLSIFVPYKRRARMIQLVIGSLLGLVGSCGIQFLSFGFLGNLLYSMCLGVGIGTFIPFVGKIYSSAMLQTATRQAFLSFGFAALLYFFILGLPTIAGAVITAALPIVLMAVILSIYLVNPRSPRNSLMQPERDKVREIIKSRPVIIFFFGVALLGAAFGFSMATCSTFGSSIFGSANLWAVLLTGGFVVVYLLLIYSPKRSFDFEKYFTPVTPIIVVGLLLVAYNPLMSSVFIIAGFQLADIVIWVVFCWIAGHSGLPQRVFCVGKAAMYLGMLIGSVAGRAAAISPEVGSTSMITATIVAYLLVIAIAFIFSNSKVVLSIKASSSEADMGYITRAIELRCDELGQKYGLTMREKEVFAYLMQGRSLPYIESTLHISRGTANTHRNHIYAKTQIHSKQELLDLFFNFGNENTPKA
jgi:DNA-binding CsgD family transcriptional regulator